MMLSKYLISAIVIAGFQTQAYAEDDLMSILEGKSATPAAQFVESEEVAKLKKAVNPSSAEQNIFFPVLGRKEL